VQRIWVQALLVVVLTVSALGPIGARTKPTSERPSVDVRVLIDVSGSMKKNDPGNLRIPAIELLTRVLPHDAKAGIYTFAQSVHALSPPGPVTAPWKKRALSRARTIHSRGLFTDIEGALAVATRDWMIDSGSEDRANEATNKAVILLTDGMVDVSKRAEESAESRERIVNDLVRLFKDRDVSVYAIALSENADHDLMSLLAEATSGWFESITNADELNRSFLRMFEASSKSTNLPIRNGGFRVDKSVSELTLVLFSPRARRNTELTLPDGAILSAKQYPGNVKWHLDESYELITVSKPDAGQWHLNATEDPDNRAMIVSDLKLHVADGQSFITPDQSHTLTAHVTEKGVPIRRRDFLELLAFSAATSAESEQPLPSPAVSLNDSGEFAVAFHPDGNSGTFVGKLVVDAKTFQRERTVRWKAAWPVSVSVSPREIDGSWAYDAKVHFPLSRASKPSGLSTAPISASLVSPDGSWRPIILHPETLSNDLRALKAVIRGLQAPGRHELYIESPQRRFGPFDFDVAPDHLSRTPIPDAPVARAMTDPPPATAEVNWAMVWALVGGTNFLLVLLSALSFWWWWREERALYGLLPTSA
jgi:hypothetical protein